MTRQRARPAPDSLAVAVLLTMVVALGPVSTDLYLPSLPAIRDALGTDEPNVQLTLSGFLVAFALCQLVHGPLSDRFGRRPVLIGGLFLYLAASVLCMLAPSIGWLVAGRFLQALGACVGPVVGRAVVRDVYGRERAAKVLAYMGAAMALAPAIGPVLGGLMQQWLGWQANFALMAVFGGAAVAGTLLLLAETNRHRNPEATRPGRLLANYRLLVGDRTYLGYVAMLTSGYAGLFAFISGSSFVFIDYHGLSETAFGFCFAAAVGGYMAGTLLSGRLSGRLRLERLATVGALLTAGAGTMLAVLGIAGIDSVAAILMPMAVYMAGIGFVMPNATAGAIGPFPAMAGAAAALAGFCTYGFAAIWGNVAARLHDGTPLVMTCAIGIAGLATLAAERLIVPRRPPPTAPAPAP
jgi:DHA1 family bicyclomycin/chloramphenicol resistance-like MFS transporter